MSQRICYLCMIHINVQRRPIGTALGTYALLGFFAAARYGSDTRGNILQNEWLDSVAGFVLNASMVGTLLARA